MIILEGSDHGALCGNDGMGRRVEGRAKFVGLRLLDEDFISKRERNIFGIASIVSIDFGLVLLCLEGCIKGFG